MGGFIRRRRRRDLEHRLVARAHEGSRLPDRGLRVKLVKEIERDSLRLRAVVFSAVRLVKDNVLDEKPGLVLSGNGFDA